MKPHFNVAVTCVGGRLIYDIIRALRDAMDYTVTVIGIDADPAAAGRLLCDHFAVLPMAEADSEGWLAGIRQLRTSVGLQGLICLSDQEARLASLHRDALMADGIVTSVGPWHTVEAMTDKLLLLERLAAGGIDTGEFMAVTSIQEITAALRALGYPDRRIVLKPRRGRGSRGVLVFDPDVSEFRYFLPDRFCGTGNRDQVLAEMEKKQVELDEWVAVPYWDGAVFDVECLVQDGQMINVAARRRQLRNPFWPTSTGHIVDMDIRVIDYATSICRVLGVEAAADFDIVLRPDGRPAPFDASARFSGSVGGSYTAGVNFLAQLVRVMFRLPPAQYQMRNLTPLRPFITMAAIPDANQDDLL